MIHNHAQIYGYIWDGHLDVSEFDVMLDFIVGEVRY